MEKKNRLVGRSEGIQLGEKRKQREMAERMLKAGEPQDKVIQFAGLRAKEVAAISEKLGLSLKNVYLCTQIPSCSLVIELT